MRAGLARRLGVFARGRSPTMVNSIRTSWASPSVSGSPGRSAPLSSRFRTRYSWIFSSTAAKSSRVCVRESRSGAESIPANALSSSVSGKWAVRWAISATQAERTVSRAAIVVAPEAST